MTTGSPMIAVKLNAKEQGNTDNREKSTLLMTATSSFSNSMSLPLKRSDVRCYYLTKIIIIAL